jgi:hypothetical protein
MEKSAHRHTWIASITRILHYCEAAGLFDSNEPLCPVATAPRQYDSDYARAIYARRRPEEGIGGRPRVILLRTLVQSNETDRADCHVTVRRRHVNAGRAQCVCHFFRARPEVGRLWKARQEIGSHV